MPSLHFRNFRRIAPLLCLVALGTPAAFADDSNAKLGGKAPLAPPTEIPSASDDLSKWRVNDEDPEKSIPSETERNGDPLQFGYHLMDLAEKGGAASKRGNHHAAAKYFAALAKAVPDRSVAFSRLCAEYEALNDWEKAVDACRSALGRQGVTVNDSAHFVRLMLTKRGGLSTAEIDDVTEVVTHLAENETTRSLAVQLQCEIGLRLEDVNRLEQCTTALAATAPADPRTISFQWALALFRKDYAEARSAIERAKEAAIPAESIQQMEQATLKAEPLWRRGVRDWRISGGAAAGLTVVLALVFGRRRAMMTVRSSS